MQNKKYIVLFDGICNLCNKSVQFIIKHDSKNKFVFASLQTDAAKNILLHKNSKKINNSNLNTILLVKNDCVYQESTAVLLILKELKIPINLLFAFIIIPKFIRDYFYKIISKKRYDWFGKTDSCWIPEKKIVDRFLS